PAEEMTLHLLSEILARARVGEAQAILVDQHRLVLEPLRPRLLRYVLVDALAEFARIRRKVEAFSLVPELDALNHACHCNVLSPLILGRQLSHPAPAAPGPDATPRRARSAGSRTGFFRRPGSAAGSCRGRASAAGGATARSRRNRARRTSRMFAWSGRTGATGVACARAARSRGAVPRRSLRAGSPDARPVRQALRPSRREKHTAPHSRRSCRRAPRRRSARSPFPAARASGGPAHPDPPAARVCRECRRRRRLSRCAGGPAARPRPSCPRRRV